MFATLTSAIRTAAIATTATLMAVGILTLAPATIREREIAAAKARLMARRQASEIQAQQRRRAIERELAQMKVDLRPIAISPIESDVLAPVSDSTEMKAESAETDYRQLTIRELKAIASRRHIKGYGNLTKAELVRVLNS